MNKRNLIQAVVVRLEEERALYTKAADAARAEATDEQSRAENKYDTRGLEASYLAQGQSKHIAEIERAIAEFENLADRQFGKDDPIDVGACVELEHGRERSLYLLGPRAGGTEVTVGGNEVIIITPQSPLGSQLVGSKQGDLVSLHLHTGRQKYRIVNVA
jgi:transcription elongation GreA/GreB family factor